MSLLKPVMSTSLSEMIKCLALPVQTVEVASSRQEKFISKK